MTNSEARFNKSLRPRKPEGSLGRTAQDVHLDYEIESVMACHFKTHKHRQALVYDTILPLEEGAGKRCSECG